MCFKRVWYFIEWERAIWGVTVQGLKLRKMSQLQR